MQRGTRRVAVSAVVSPLRVENSQLRVWHCSSPPPRVPKVGVTQMSVETKHKRARRESRKVPTAATMIVCVRPSYLVTVSEAVTEQSAAIALAPSGPMPFCVRSNSCTLLTVLSRSALQIAVAPSLPRRL